MPLILDEISNELCAVFCLFGVIGCIFDEAVGTPQRPRIKKWFLFSEKGLVYSPCANKTINNHSV